ncbi:PGC-1 and ERR-induced regulator in muscle protein 1 [Discoglossus pictus]
MDNFEYSIQINDRDWAEFYTTAEECNLMQVSLATEEDILLSDPEDVHLYPSATLSTKLIRVSLCPPQDERPTVQCRPVPVLNTRHSRFNSVAQNDDVLSGSEDEEDLGSVTRFLCQRETQLYKEKMAVPREDIPVLKENEVHYSETYSNGAVGKLETGNGNTSLFYKTDVLQETVGNLIQNGSMSGQETKAEHCNNGHALLVEPELLHRTKSKSKDLDNGTDSIDGSFFKTQRPSSINGSPLTDNNSGGENNKNVRSDNSDNCVNTSTPLENHIENSNGTGVHSLLPEKASHRKDSQEEPDIFSKDSSEAQQQMREPITALVECPKSIFNNLGEVLVCGALECNPGQKLDTDNIINQEITVTTSSSMHQAIPTSCSDLLNFYKPSMHNPEPTEVSESFSPVYEAGSGGRKYSTAGITTLSVRLEPNSVSDEAIHIVNPTVQLFASPSESCALSIPEMYEFFYSDVPEAIASNRKYASLKEHGGGVVYTPEMYEYFFLENNEEECNRYVTEKEQIRQKSSTALVLASSKESKNKLTSEALSLPEAYEFFFADTEDDQKDRQGIMVSIPAYQAQRAAKVLQSFLPQGLCRVRKGVAVRGSHHKRGSDGKLIAHERFGHQVSAEDTAVAVTGSSVFNMSSGKGDMCLVFLAFASWAVTSPDLKSSDGWKTALLANIGAISAIRYMRRRAGVSGRNLEL